MDTPQINKQSKRKAINKLKSKKNYVDGNAPNQPDTTTPKTGEVISGVKGYISQLGTIATYNPDELLKRKGQSISFYERMHTDDKLSGIHDFKTKAVLAVDWEIRPADDSVEAIKYRDFVKGQIDAMSIPFVDVLRNFYDAWYQGYKIGEKVWEARDGYWWIKCIKCKPSDWFYFETDAYDNLINIKMKTDYSNVEKEKVVLYIHPYLKDGNWYGTSDYKAIYREWWSKDTMIKLGNVAVEGYADPIRKVVYDFDKMTQQQIDDMESAVENFHDNYAIYIPGIRAEEGGTLLPLFDLTFLETNKKPGDEFKAKVEEYNTAIARRLLIGDKLGYTDSPGGSYALGEVHFDLLMSVIGDIHRRTEDIFNPQLIDDIMKTNFPSAKKEMYPKLKFMEIEQGVTAEKVKIIKDGIDAGLINPVEEWIRPYLRFPELAEGIELPQPRQQQQPIPPGTQFRVLKNNKLSKQEIIDRVNFKQLEKDLDENETEMVGNLTDVFEMMRVDAMNKTGKMADSGSIKAGDFGFKQAYSSAMTEALETGLGKVYMDGRRSAKDEVKSAKQRNFAYEPFIPVVDILLDDYVEKYSSKLLSKDSETFRRIKQMAKSYVSGSVGKLTSDIESILIDYTGKLSVEEIRQKVSEEFDAYLETGSVDGDSPEPYRVNTLVRTSSTQLFNEGRVATYLDPDLEGFVQALMYSAIMDDRTTVFCSEHNKEIIEASDPLVQLMPPAHYNCRSTWIPVFRGEDYNLDWDYSIEPAEGFGGN